MRNQEEKLLFERIEKNMKDHACDPTNFQCNKMLKVLRERLSIFIPKDTFNHNEEYMYTMLKTLVYMTSEFIAENKALDKKEVSDEK